MMQLFRTLLIAALTAVCFAQAPQRALLIVSIDGMHPDYVLKADEYHLRIPNLRRILRDGAHASGVRGVLPTVTYPSHTTLMTGVWPVKHGIYNNVTFDPLGKNMDGWYWYAEDIKVPTLWQAASRAGYVTGSVSWPVTVAAPGISYNLPEVWRAQTPDDFKLLRAVSTPGIQTQLQKYAGPYIMNLDDAFAGDRARAAYASAMIVHKGVRILTLHLAAVDHLEHSAGPFSKPAFDALEQADKLIGDLERSFHEVKAEVATCIVSDHGFARNDRELNLNIPFVKAGLLTPNPKKASMKPPGILGWKAQPWMAAGGSAAIMLKDPNDGQIRAEVERLLRSLAADANNGIAGILDPAAIAKLGGPPNAAWVVDMRPGYTIGTAMDGPLVRNIKVSGTHGYSPTHPELLASFFFAGHGVRKGVDLGQIDMRVIAPTLAHYLGVPLPSADLPPAQIMDK